MKENTQHFNTLISVIFHPIIYPLLVALLSLEIIPRFYHSYVQYYIFLIVLLGSVLIPIIILYYLKKNQIITSFQLDAIHERKYPYVFFTITSIIVSRILFKLGLINDLAIYFLAGSISFLLGYWMLLFKQKVSIHTMGIGSVIGYLCCLSFLYKINLLLFILVFFLIFGFVSKARIELKSHNFLEVMLGFVIGLLPQIILVWIY